MITSNSGSVTPCLKSTGSSYQARPRDHALNISSSPPQRRQFNPSAISANTQDIVFQEVSELGKEAIKYTRDSLPFKTPNKFYGCKKIPENKEERYNRNACFERVAVLKIIRNGEKSILKKFDTSTDFKQKIKALSECITSMGDKATENCSGHSIIAYNYLLEHLSDNINCMDFISLKPPGDHGFIAINQPKNADESYPLEFSDWDENAIIVDSWAKIVCPARDYPKEWKGKMEKWDRRGLKIIPHWRILNDPSEIETKLISPKECINEVEQHHKESNNLWSYNKTTPNVR